MAFKPNKTFAGSGCHIRAVSPRAGNVGSGSIKGLGSWQFDLSVSRTFQIREMKRLEFRAEAFNVTNSFNMNNPTTDFNSNLFGKVTSAKDPRIMQFALKYLF